jgi:hypothetical protein
MHIRSTSHHQKMMELEKQKANSATSSSDKWSSSAVSKSDVSSSAGQVRASGDEKTMVQSSQSSSATMDSVKGPNYCHVCCFEFASGEVGWFAANNKF